MNAPLCQRKIEEQCQGRDVECPQCPLYQPSESRFKREYLPRLREQYESLFRIEQDMKGRIYRSAGIMGLGEES